MKKLLTLILSLAMIFALAISVSAIGRGQSIVEYYGYFDERLDSPAPGDTVYIALAEAYNNHNNSKIDSAYVPTSANLTSAKTISFANDKDYKLLKTGSLKIVSEKVEEGSEWYFAVLEIPTISLSEYPEDGFDVSGTIKVTRRGGSTFTIDLSKTFDSIAYEEAASKTELKKTVQRYYFKNGSDIEMSFSNNKGYFYADVTSDITFIAGMSHTKISSILDLAPNATMTFYIGNEYTIPNIRNGKLVIEADSDTYLYEIGSNNKLTDRSNYYDDDENAYIIETSKLGKYVVSSSSLKTGVELTDNEYDYIYEGEDDEVKEDNTITSVVPDYNFIITNPSTGAKA